MALRADDVDLNRDRELVQQYQAGDEAAFEALYRCYFERLYRFCLRRVGDPHEAEEVAQEAFTRAYRFLPELSGDRRFYPWLSVIAARLCVDTHRRRARSEPAEIIDLGAYDGGQERIIQAVDADLIRQAIGRLSATHRQVLALREEKGWSYQHIAEHLDVSLGTVEARLFRARKALRREFDSLADPGALAGLPVLGWLGRKLSAFRSRVADLSAAITPAMGNALAAAVIVSSGAVLTSAAPATGQAVGPARVAPVAAIEAPAPAATGAPVADVPSVHAPVRAATPAPAAPTPSQSAAAKAADRAAAAPVQAAVPGAGGVGANPTNAVADVATATQNYLNQLVRKTS
jgi:RNA polymerase sigma-70 factor (ECF subfamily)